MINWLQHWYIDQCDGDWEHENGIKIETADNPGWIINIDLVGSKLEGLEIPYTLIEKSNNTWFGYSITNNVFKGACSPTELNTLIEAFKKVYESKEAR